MMPEIFSYRLPRIALPIACLTGVLLSSQVASAQKRKPVPAPEDVYAALANAPKKVSARANPLADDPEAVRAGGKLFEMHCAECHGEMAEGSKRAPSLLATQVQSASAGTLFWLLTNGVVRRGMPVWSKLPEPQRWQLVSYIKSLGPAGSTEKTADSTSRKRP